jgi:hypothetical protein
VALAVETDSVLFAGGAGVDGPMFTKGVLFGGASLDCIGSCAEVGAISVVAIFGVVLESNAKVVTAAFVVMPIGVVLAITVVLRLVVVMAVVVGARVVVLDGRLQAGVAAMHCGWHAAMAAPEPAQLHVPVVPHPSTVPGAGLHVQHLEQHQVQSALSQPQPLAHPMKLLPTA